MRLVERIISERSLARTDSDRWIRNDNASTITLSKDADSVTACLLCLNALTAVTPTIAARSKQTREITSVDVANRFKDKEGDGLDGALTYWASVMSHQEDDITRIAA